MTHDEIKNVPNFGRHYSSVVDIHANLAIIATPEWFVGHQVYVLDPRWLSSLIDKLDISC